MRNSVAEERARRLHCFSISRQSHFDQTPQVRDGHAPVFAAHDAAVLVAVHDLHQICGNFEVERWLEQIHEWKMKLEKETDPYTAPQSVRGGVVSARRKATKLAKIGARLQLVPIVGNLVAMLGMSRAISTFTSELVFDPEILIAGVGGVLMWMVLGVTGSMTGCVLLGLAVFVQRNQPRWVKVALGLAILVALQGSFVLLMMIGCVLDGRL